MDNHPVRMSIVVRGIVQGVSFRKSACRIAQELQLRGWVKNDPSGSVQICVEGTESSVMALVVWCYAGPERATVTDVAVEHRNYLNEFDGFEIR